ncbi:hypothetical protein [Tenacibaculum sp. M341]|uniref:FEKKY domain-containing protein n=1 Tax=Tenacibaculum sp. M341 TaxID=2530339 RepID=UPI001046A2D4|nr:hypothetical protein [Tenacibaculum sp. M341]TCI84525.1 hypothetical protein EYW44_21005 [Tenacibaculum sp. M341]
MIYKLILFFSFFTSFGQTIKTEFEISGKVKIYLVDEWIDAKEATVELIKKNKISDLDNSGKYKFKVDKTGSYELRVLNFNDSKIFHLEIIGELKNNFDLYVDIDCDFNKLTAEKDIKMNKPRLLLASGIVPFLEIGQEKIENKYNFKYYDFGCILPHIECAEQYNKIIFNYLDKKYGMNWRKDIRKDVIGL